jgi:uncharacterized protein (DUF1015 family)
MTEIFPFIGTRYNSRLIEDMKLVISPSYDILNPEAQQKFCEQHPNNILHLIPSCCEDDDEEYNNSYLRIASTIQAWRRDGILVNDNHKSFYFYEQTYAKPTGSSKTHRGLFALINLSGMKQGQIVMEGSTPYFTKSYHLKLLRATKCNFSPLSMFFHDKKKDFSQFCDEITSTKPWEEFVDFEGNMNRLWVLNKKELINKVTGIFQDKDCVLIEGHDRYDTALKYAKEQSEMTGKPNGQQSFNYTLVFLSSFEEDCVSTKPVHRVLSSELGSGVDIQEILDDLSENFTLQQIKVSLKNPQNASDKILHTIHEKGKKHPTMGMVLGDGRIFSLSLKNTTKLPDLYDEDITISDAGHKLDVNILYHHIIRQIWIGNPELELEEEDILYYEDPVAALNQIIKRKASVSFFLNPCPISQLNEVVKAGDTVPSFTVRLHPSLMSGLIIRDISVRH